MAAGRHAGNWVAAAAVVVEVWLSAKAAVGLQARYRPTSSDSILLGEVEPVEYCEVSEALEGTG